MNKKRSIFIQLWQTKRISKKLEYQIKLKAKLENGKQQKKKKDGRENIYWYVKFDLLIFACVCPETAASVAKFISMKLFSIKDDDDDDDNNDNVLICSWNISPINSNKSILFILTFFCFSLHLKIIYKNYITVHWWKVENIFMIPFLCKKPKEKLKIKKIIMCRG